MSNKNIPNPEAMPVVQRESTTLNGTTASPLKSSPLFGWLFAGSDLLSAKLDQAAGVVSQKIDNTQETINAMQTKGLEVESELRRTLNPFALVDTAQKLVASTPLFSVLSGGQKRQQKEQQLDMLSAKVDLLVEQVALLAAKEAAKKVEVASTASKAATPKRAASKTATATAKPSAEKSTTTSTTATSTRKSSASKSTATSASTSKKASTGTSGKRTAAKPATTKAPARKTSASVKSSSTESTASPSDTSKSED
ncbi:hypothetical protein E5672_15195 [Alteromonas portus]|uniref:Uncharacterized protein n=1 Tax=Alteromonas portus TaxID=2565549 RepID=A0A4U0ZGB0_9ALTE|nr:hypothetical protein [Alteromonas portus]TKB02443.1 hypothetical protein E5672_15195 [Alteromonas portus]